MTFTKILTEEGCYKAVTYMDFRGKTIAIRGETLLDLVARELLRSAPQRKDTFWAFVSHILNLLNNGVYSIVCFDEDPLNTGKGIKDQLESFLLSAGLWCIRKGCSARACASLVEDGAAYTVFMGVKRAMFLGLDSCIVVARDFFEGNKPVALFDIKGFREKEGLDKGQLGLAVALSGGNPDRQDASNLSLGERGSLETCKKKRKVAVNEIVLHQASKKKRPKLSKPLEDLAKEFFDQNKADVAAAQDFPEEERPKVIPGVVNIGEMRVMMNIMKVSPLNQTMVVNTVTNLPTI